MAEEKAHTELFGALSQDLLSGGLGFRFQARGTSMAPTIQDGEILQVTPVRPEALHKGDIVLFADGRRFRAHRLVRVDHQREVFMTRGDAGSEMDRPLRAQHILGKVVSTQATPGAPAISLCSLRAGIQHRTRQVRSSVSRMLRRVAMFRKPALGLFLLSLLFAPSFVKAQVTVDATASNGVRLVTGTTTITVPITTGTGTNRFLVAGISINRNNNVAVAVSGVTYNGTALTFAGAQNDPTGIRRVEMWYLVNPVSGANSVVATFSGVNAANTGATVGVITFSGVDQTTPARAFTGINGASGTNPSLAVTSATGEVVLDTVVATGNRTVTAGAGQTQRWTFSTGGTAATDARGAGSTAPGAATVTMNETLNNNSSWAQGAISIRPAGVLVDSTTSTGTTVTGATPTITLAHTTAGSNRAMVVGVSINISNNTAATVSGITYNGVALTLAGFHNDAGNSRRVEIWSLAAPALGTNNVVVTINNPGGAATLGVVVGATTLTGADQTSPIRGFASNDGAASGVASLNVPSAFSDLVLDTMATGGDQTVTAFGATQTAVWQLNSGGTGTPPNVFGTGSTRPGAPSVPMSETLSGTSNWSVGAVSVRPLQAEVAVSVVGNTTFFPANLTYTITTTNNGPSSATGVTLTDTLAAGLTFVSATPSQGTCSGNVPPITCPLGTLAPGASATVTVVVTPTASGGYPNTASVLAAQPDFNTGNNSAMGIAYSQSTACGTPAKNGDGGVLTGTINTYFPGTTNAAAGAKAITVGASIGSTTPIAIGDLLLVIQMQDAAINSSNTSAYGDGGSGSGSNNLNNSGVYEFVLATSALGVGGGTVNISGTGPTGGLLYAYTNAAATATQGQRRFQVVRVPQFSSASLSSTITVPAWNGTAGGIFVLDVAGILNLNSATLRVDGLGFRGGAGMQLTGGAGANSDFRQTAPAGYTGTAIAGVDAPKGEGIAGTPRYVESGTTFLDTTVEGYPNGSMGRGAPGNGGGGGNDADPVANDQNAGGGGGGNGGTGGLGGDAWNSNLSVGGLGGATFPATVGRIVLGGGGGAGTRNNSPGDAQASAGAAGGGIVIIRADGLTGTATITANGAAAYNGTANDAGGGGGAGGSIIVVSATGGEGGLTVAAHGGRGGDAWDTQPFSLADRHGPGGGGAGGVVLISGAPASSDVTGGASGTTLNPGVTYGATAGSAGVSVTNAQLPTLPGSRSGAECTSDLTINKTHSGNFIRMATGTFTLTVNNISLNQATSGSVTVTDSLPTGLVPTLATGTGWACSIVAQKVTCTRADALAAVSSYPVITITVSVAGTAPNSVVNTATVAGGGELNGTNDTATDTVTIVSSSDLAITKSGAPNPVKQGQTVTYTLVVTNNGPTDASGVSVTDTLPSQVSYVSATPTQGSCSQAAGIVTCALGSIANGGTATITIVVTAVTPSQAVNTATVSGTQPDPVPANNTATQTEIITFPTSVKLNSFTAASRGGEVMLTWNTGSELRNLGFNLYREQNGERVRMNPSLIAGSALIMRGGLPQHAAKTYAWIDHSPAAGGSYWLEDVDLDGTRTMHGPVSPQANLAPSKAAPAKMIGELNSSAAIADADTSSSHEVEDRIQSVSSRTDVQQFQFQLAASPAVKIMVTNEGWYRVTQPQLVAAGLDPNVDPRFLELFAEAIEQPVRITGATDGPGGFGPQAAIEFYGRGLDTPYSDQRAYWLVSGHQAGRRIHQMDSSGEGQVPQNFPQTVELKQRTTYFAALLRDNTDNFFGALISATPVDETINAPGVATSATDDVRLRVVLQGVTQAVPHQVAVTLNGAALGNVNFTGESEGDTEFRIPAGQLLEGANTVTLTALAGDTDISLVDYLKLRYSRTYTAQFDHLKFTATAGDHVTVTGFNQAPTRLLDITDPLQPLDLTIQSHVESGKFVLEVNVPTAVSGTHTLIALADNAIKPPFAVMKNHPSSWHRVQPGADEVMLTASYFADQLAPLVKLRQGQGQSVAVVRVEDLYDEFNFGERSPYAIKSFLKTAATNWQKKPRYLLLMGDASVDPRDYLGFGYFDFVPTRIITTTLMKTASDDWFSDLDNTGFAQIATGRLPARTTDDASTMVSKIVNYEKGSNPGPWTSQALLVADVDDPFVSFTQEAQSIQTLLPPTIAVTNVFATGIDPQTARDEILAGINSGKLLVNYDGHGAVEVWSGEDLLDDTSAGTLTNGGQLPLFVIMNCLNGFFHDVYTQSLAEALLLSKNGGAVAVWASSGLTSPQPQLLMNQKLTNSLFQQPAPALGDAVKNAKANIDDADARATFILFSDPLLHLRQPGTASGQQPSSH
jgi:uncharacterized repeat protein (TIGR01451 family)